MPSTSSSGRPDLRTRRGLLAIAALLVVVIVAGITTWVVVDTQDGNPSSHTIDNATCDIRLPTDTEAPSVGTEPPTFALRGLDGSCFDLSSARGRPVIVNFWASWCNPCRDEFPMFRKAYRRYKQEGLEIAGVTHNDIASDARHFARRQHATWPLLRDDTNAVADAYGVTGIPQTFFIARDGTLSAHLFGLSEQDFEVELRRILASGA